VHSLAFRPGSRTPAWAVVVGMAGVAAASCTSRPDVVEAGVAAVPTPDAGSSDNGSVTMQLRLASGGDVGPITYTLSGPGGYRATGTISGSSATVAGVPAGSGYVVSLVAGSQDGGGIGCSGQSAPFNVASRASVTAVVALVCTTPPGSTGVATVRGDVVNCPTLRSLNIVPADVSVGGSMPLLSAGAIDDGSPVTYAWAVDSGGIFADPTAAATTFTCTAEGFPTLSLTIDSADHPGVCPLELLIEVACEACRADGDACQSGDTCAFVHTCRSGQCVGTSFAAASSACGPPGNVCDGAGRCVECASPGDCPGTDADCAGRTCVANRCGFGDLPAGAVLSSTPGTCKQRQCDGHGNVVSVTDNTNTPSASVCLQGTCTQGQPTFTALPAETSCGPGLVCNGGGACVPCVAARDCPGQDSMCSRRACVNNVCGFAPAIEGTTCFDNGGSMCDGTGSCVPISFEVVRAGDGSAPLGSAAAPVFLERRAVDGTLLDTRAVAPVGTDAGAGSPFAVTGNGAVEGALSRSADGRFLSLAGFSPVTRDVVVARVDALGRVDTSTHFASIAAGSETSATSSDGSTFWIGGAGASAGVAFAALGATSASSLVPSSGLGGHAVRALGVFGGQLYGAADAAPPFVFAIGSGLPSSGSPPAAELAGLPATAGPSPWQFVFVDLNPAVAGVDTLYVADDRATAGGGIQRYTFNGAAWSPPTAIATGVGVRGLAAINAGGTIWLMATTAGSPGAPNSLVILVDGGSPTTLATAPANTTYLGVAPSAHP
jgi:hypothetical protein